MLKNTARLTPGCACTCRTKACKCTDIYYIKRSLDNKNKKATTRANEMTVIAIINNSAFEFQGEICSFKVILNTVHAIFDSLIVMLDEKCRL